MVKDSKGYVSLLRKDNSGANSAVAFSDRSLSSLLMAAFSLGPVGVMKKIINCIYIIIIM